MLDFYIFGSVIIVSLISFVGAVVLATSDKIGGPKFEVVILWLVALAIGALGADAALHLMPEALAMIGLSAWPLFIGGLIAFFLLDKVLHWRHHHPTHTPGKIEPRGIMNLVGDGLHNATDGIAIALSYIIATPTGIATSLAVILHEIPQELGDYGILRDAGFTRRAAIFWNFISALAAILAAFIVRVWLGEKAETFSQYLLAFTAGGFAYITYLLVKHLRENRNSKSWLFFVPAAALGVVVMALLKLIG